MKDIKIDSKGRILFENHDIGTAYEDRTLIQEIKIILKSIKDKYWKGANLEDYLGKPNIENIRSEISNNVSTEVETIEILSSKDFKVIVKEGENNSINVSVIFISPMSKNRYEIKSTIELNSSTIL